MPDAVLLILLAFGVYRLAQVISIDEIFEPVRSFISNRKHLGLGYKWTDALLDCPYCLGVWISIVAAFIYTDGNIDIEFLISWFGIAGGQVFLQSLSEGE